MAGRVYQPSFVKRLLRYNGNWLHCETTGRVEDGMMQVIIRQPDARPIAHLIAPERLGVDYEEFQYLLTWVDAANVFVPHTLLTVYKSYWFVGVIRGGRRAFIGLNSLTWPISTTSFSTATKTTLPFRRRHERRQA